MDVNNLDQHIAIYKAMREVCPIHIGGSFALLLHGYDLKRPIHDLDIIIPESMNDFNYEPVEQAIRELNRNNYKGSTSMDNFDVGYRTFTSTGEQVNVDVKYTSNITEFIEVIYKEQSFKVTALKYIIEAKMRYALGRSRSGRKHANDLSLLHEQGCPGIDAGALPAKSIFDSFFEITRSTSNSDIW